MRRNQYYLLRVKQNQVSYHKEDQFIAKIRKFMTLSVALLFDNYI